MIASFADDGTEAIFNGENSREARASLPNNLWTVARRKLDMINAATTLEDLKVPPGNELEPLKGELAGKHSVRINRQYRIVFRWQDGRAHDVVITDYH